MVQIDGNLLLALLGVIAAIVGIPTGAIFWALTDIRTEMRQMNSRLIEIDKRINDLDKRVHGIEMILLNKDCCMLRDSRQLEKAQ
jgi:hypothetical protein